MAEDREAPSGRGLDREQRIRRTWTDAGTEPDEPADRSSFDIGRTVRALKVCTEAQARLILRKLHPRWWHAQAASATRLLQRAGVPKTVLALLPDIVGVCASCRTLTKPLPASFASAELVDTFNQQVVCDVLFTSTLSSTK